MVQVGKKLNSIIYALYGLVDVLLFTASNFDLIHIGLLGILCFATGIVLWTSKPWFTYLAIISGLFTLTVGVTTLYVSVRFIGFSPKFNVLLVYLALIVYTMVAMIQLFYVTKKKEAPVS